MPTEEPVYIQLIRTARKLADTPGASAADIRRSVSSAYYALFHFLCHNIAATVLGEKPETRRAWRDAYRALNHSRLKALGNGGRKNPKVINAIDRFPPELRDFASILYSLYSYRIEADYDPLAIFDEFEASTAITLSELAMEKFRSADDHHQRAFIAYLLFSNARRP